MKSSRLNRWRTLAIGAVTAALALPGLAAPTPAAATGPRPPVPAAAAASMEGRVESDIYLAPVTGMRPDTIRGIDIGSVIANENSGVRYFNWDGVEQDVFEIFAEAGVNLVRIRIWNDPWYTAADGTRHGFGGGNNDVDKAIQIGQRATAAGMGVQLNFHYSDFWADPGKQMSPRAWEGLSLTDRAEALHDFTYDAVRRITDAGVDVWQVQIGNETNNAMAGVSGLNNVATLMRSGIDAVRAVDNDIPTVVHFTNPQNPGFFVNAARTLRNNGVDFDIFGASYYSFWHGTLDNLTQVLSDVANEFDVDVLVVETSWAWTTADGDGFPNNVPFTGLEPNYPLSVQGQATAVRDVFQAVADVDNNRGLGVIYWEPAWIPVGPPNQFANNQLLWETHGSGWASSFAAAFDPYDAGEWYGGSGWDNQALFDFAGQPLASLNLFNYIQTGAFPRDGIVVDTAMDEAFQIEYAPGMTAADVIAAAPSQVTGVFLDNSRQPLPVTWNQAAIDDALHAFRTARAITNANIAGVAYEAATGRTFDVTMALTVLPLNMVQNHSFESADLSMWRGVNATQAQGSPARRAYNPRTDAYSVWFNGGSWTIEQDITIETAGWYAFQMFLQGAWGEPPMHTFVRDTVTGEYLARQGTGTSGWMNWSDPLIQVELNAGQVVTVGLDVALPSGHWGTLDDFFFWYVGSYTPVEDDEPVADDNLVLNPSFEDADVSMWQFDEVAGAGRTSGDSRTGGWGFGWYPTGAGVRQDIVITEDGVFDFSAYVQGRWGDDIYAYALVNGVLAARVTGALQGWAVWQRLYIAGLELVAGDVVTVGAVTDADGGSWGRWDDFSLVRVGDLPDAPDAPDYPAADYPDYPEYPGDDDGGYDRDYPGYGDYDVPGDDDADYGYPTQPAPPAYPAWNAAEVFNTGDRVVYDGRVFEAQWWTSGQAPVASGSHGAWMEIQYVATYDGTPIPVWTPSRVFNAGDLVSWEGQVFRASWWTRNQSPDTPWGPWQPVGS